MGAFKINWPWNRGAKNEAGVKQKGKRIYSRLKRVREFRVDLEMDELGKAIDAAKDTERPDFENLYSIYGQIKKDRHLKSQVEIATNDIQQSPFIVTIDGKEDEELRGLFDAEWFDDYIEYAADAENWGHSLIEFPEVNEDQEFAECFLIPRENTNPELQHIILDRDSNELLPYAGKLEELNLIEIYGKEPLGIYEYAAEEIILKKYARTDWSQASERYAQPLLDIETDTQDKKELDEIEDYAQNFGTNGYIIHGSDTKVTIQQPQRGDFYKIYQESITLANDELSKLMNGQSGTSDNQAWAGTAEVHERIKNTFALARLRRIQSHSNGKLIPLMVKNGYKYADRLAKAKIEYTDLLDKDPKLATEQGEDPNNPDKPGEQSKTPPSQAKGSTKKKVKAAKSKLDLWLERFFEQASKDKSIVIDPEIWKLNFNSLVKSMTEAGIEFTDTYQYADLAAELQQNAASFAAFKNHDEQQELFKLIIDEKGEPRSWNEFKKAAKPLTEQYNKEWLQTEFKQAEASAQMAVKWESFNEEADLYPNLRYDHSGNPDGRKDHKKLDGLVLPITAKEWRKIMPPNGWGCGCDVTQTDEPVNRLAFIDEFEPDKGFDFNPGFDKKLFSDDNGYQNKLTKSVKTDIGKQASDLLNNYLSE